MSGRPWTDEEIGFLQDHEDWTAPRIGEALGRSSTAVRAARKSLRQGKLGASVRLPWADEEDALLIDEGRYATAEALADALPGRSVAAIHKRRRALGLETQMGLRPFDVGGRPLVAKTCLKCGRLLAGAWFSFQKKQNGWASYCRPCNSEKAHESKDRGKGRWTADMSRAAREKLQRITLPLAERRGEPYTDADLEVLADPSLTDLQKALRLKRTYGAISTSRHHYGFKSKPDGLGDPERDVWVIDNPNAPTTTGSAA